MNRLGQHRTSILWFQGTFPPKPSEDLQRLSLPEEWKCPRLCALGVHCDSQGWRGLGGSPRQGHSPSRSGVWMQARPEVSNLSACNNHLLASQRMHSPHSAPTDYLSMIRNVTNIFGKSIVGEVAEDMPGWTLQPREASWPNSAGFGSGRTVTPFFWGRTVAKQLTFLEISGRD